MTEAKLRHTMWVVSLVTIAGATICVVRVAYERIVWNMPDAALLFSALHSELAMFYWLAIMCFLFAHAWALVLLVWGIARRNDRVRSAALAALLAVEVGLGHAPSKFWSLFR